MATIPPINYGALKVSFPANLPRNEKDLICMLLAGRLKDLWNGKLICAQLALDDLIKSATGVSGLETLRATLLTAKASLDKFKQASGYDKILNGVNKALGQVNNVFSLGGLCPSPVTAPKIPDILGQLNQNLFGQANNILNALTQASNPKVCLGGGPKGFGIDWSQVTGDLKLLKNVINDFKNNPAGYQNTIKAFNANLKSQERRLNAELKRLEKNLTDPFGINEKKNTVGAIQRAKSISDGIPVKDKNGITYNNPLRLMLSGEIDSVLGRTDPLFASPVNYQTYPVYDYCGELTGYERRVVTGDANYIGWDPVFTDTNTSLGSELPESTPNQYDYTILEQSGQLSILDTKENVVSTLTIERGKHYRIKTKLVSATFQIRTGSSVWASGIRVTAEPDFGQGFEIIQLDETLSVDKKSVEMDWAVSVENPTTPNNLTLTASTGQSFNIVVNGITSIPDEDKTYDISNAMRKSLMFIESVNHTYPSGSILTEESITTRQYTINSTATGSIQFGSVSSLLSYDNGYSVIDDTETLDADGNAIEGNKILKIVQPYNSSYIVTKLYFNEANGLDIFQYSAYLTNDLTNEDNGYQLLASLKYPQTVEFLNDVKLPFTDNKEHMLTLADGTKLINTDKITVEKVSDSSIRAKLTSNSEALSPGEFVLVLNVHVDPNDPGREYQTTNPFLLGIGVKFKGTNFDFEQTVLLNN